MLKEFKKVMLHVRNECNSEKPDADRFEEIMQEILELTQEAYEILSDDNESLIQDRALACWVSRIPAEVNDGGSYCTMEDTLDEIKEKYGI